MTGSGNWLRGVVGQLTGTSKPQPNTAKKFLASSDPTKWDSMIRNHVGSKRFVKDMLEATDDPTLKQHIVSMYELQHAPVVANIVGSSGKVYDVKKLPDGHLGCTCEDWRYRGSIDPGYKCKHIRAFEDGRTKVATTPFAAQMSSFTRELGNILSQERMNADQSWMNSQGDFTDMPQTGTDLTRMEEPAAPLYDESQMAEPEIIARNGIARIAG